MGKPKKPVLRFLAVMVFAALWLLGSALAAAAVAPATKIAWFRFESLWRAPAATAGLCFVLEYAYPGRWLTRRNLVLLSIPALLDILLVVADNAQMMWQRLEVGPDGSVVAALAPAGLLMGAYGVGLVLVNIAVLLWLFIRSPQHRWPVAIIAVISWAIDEMPMTAPALSRIGESMIITTIAGQPFRRLVPTGDREVQSERDDRVHRRFHDGSQEGAILFRRLAFRHLS